MVPGHLRWTPGPESANVQDSDVIVLAEHVQRLDALDLPGCFHLTYASIVAVAKHCKQLQTLNVESCDKLTEASILAVAEGCPNLRRIQGWGDTFTCDDKVFPALFSTLSKEDNAGQEN